MIEYLLYIGVFLLGFIAGMVAMFWSLAQDYDEIMAGEAAPRISDGMDKMTDDDTE